MQALPVARATMAALLALLVLPEVPAAAPRTDPVPFATLLERTFAYVDRFAREFGSMVAEERFEQRVRSNFGIDERTVLRSDFLLVNVAGQGWTPFRDVFERDGRAVRDREDRLARLFLSGTTASAFDQAKRIMDESARYNIGTGSRNTNVPLLAMLYLFPDARPRLRFSEASRDDAAPGRVIAFEEIGGPTLIMTTNNRSLPARARLWVDEATGTINRTDLRVEDNTLNLELTVTFQPDQALGISVPQRMDERFRARGAAEVRGMATYSRFRRFQVTTSEDVGEPAGSKR
jgi:hypothetical protein